MTFKMKYFFFIIYLINGIKCQIEIKEMMKTEGKVIWLLEDYIESTKSDLQSMEKLLLNFKEKHNKFNNQSDVDNLLNGFLVTRQLTEELKKIEDVAFTSVRNYEDTIDELKSEEKSFPNDKYLSNVKNSIVTIQKYYMLSAKDILNGYLQSGNGSEYLQPPDEMYLELAKAALENTLPSIAVEWIEELIKKCENQMCDQDVYLEAIEYLAYFSYHKGDLIKARDLTLTILKQKPDDTKFKANAEFFDFEINKDSIKEHTMQEFIPPGGLLTVDELHSLTCRGIIGPDVSITSQLKCSLVHHNIPYLRIAPYKEEELYLDPRVVLYRNIINDEEIDKLINMSVKSIKPSLTVGGKSKARVSKQAWLYDREEAVNALSLKVSNITGLATDVHTAEPLQVVNYGIGGHYEWHHDYLYESLLDTKPYFGESLLDTKPENLNKVWGDRLATFLIYLNDVESGGGTVFPLLKLLVQSEKGSAILWYNLDAAGNYDNRTLHSGCPVLQGQKWIANKWIHEIGQTFIRPCPADYKKHQPLSNFKMTLSIRNKF